MTRKEEIRECALALKKNLPFIATPTRESFIRLADYILELTTPESSPARKETTKSMEITKGLYNRYIIQKTNGEPIDKNAEYFVLRLDKGGDDLKHIDACRRAIQIYAANIYGHLPELAHDIMVKWPVDQKDLPSNDPRINKLNFIAQKYGSANFVAAYVDQNNVEEIVLEAIGESSPAPLESQEELIDEIIQFTNQRKRKYSETVDFLRQFHLTRRTEGKNPLDRHSWESDDAGFMLPPKGRTEGDLEKKVSPDLEKFHDLEKNDGSFEVDAGDNGIRYRPEPPTP